MRPRLTVIVISVAGARRARKWAKSPQRENRASRDARPASGAARTERQLFDILLASYQRLLAAVPASAPWGGWPSDIEACSAIRDARASSNVATKRAVLVRLSKDESSRAVDLDLRRDYRVCQAVWATNTDYMGGRRPKVDDASLILPVAPARIKEGKP